MKSLAWIGAGESRMEIAPIELRDAGGNASRP
jgi:hypothetical protein